MKLFSRSEVGNYVRLRRYRRLPDTAPPPTKTQPAAVVSSHVSLAVSSTAGEALLATGKRGCRGNKRAVSRVSINESGLEVLELRRCAAVGLERVHFVCMRACIRAPAAIMSVCVCTRVCVCVHICDSVNACMSSVCGCIKSLCSCRLASASTN